MFFKNYKPWIWGNCKFYRLWWVLVVSAAFNFLQFTEKKMRKRKVFRFFSSNLFPVHWGQLANLSLLRKKIYKIYLDFRLNSQYWESSWTNVASLRTLLPQSITPEKKIFFMMHKCSLSHPHFALKTHSLFLLSPFCRMCICRQRNIFLLQIYAKNRPKKKGRKSFSFLLNVVIFMCNW